MADNSYQPKVYRKAGGSEFVVADGGTVLFEQGGYSYSDAALAHTTALSVLEYGVLNTVSSATTGLTLLLPTPVPGAEIWFASYDATTGAFNLCAGTAVTAIDRVIGSSTEAGLAADNNNIMLTSGNIIGLRGVNSSQWMVIENQGASACSTAVGTTA